MPASRWPNAGSLADDTTPSVPQPVWTPYTPEDCIGDFGWIWDSDSDEWLLCATVEPDGKDADLVLVFLSCTQVGEDYTADPDDWRGDPYLRCIAPTVVPGDPASVGITAAQLREIRAWAEALL